MSRLVVYQGISDFFHDYPVWENSRAAKLVLGETVSFGRETKLEYDFLFKGTHSRIYLPLWSSACADDGKSLLTQVTAEVMDVYDRFGYCPMFQDGNPADYIGEQFRFLLYLESAVIFGGKEQEQMLAATGADFLTRYTIPLLERIIVGMDQFGRLLKPAAKRLRWLVEKAFWQDIDSQITKQAESWCEFAGIRAKGVNRPLPKALKTIIPTAGINNCGGMCIIRPHVRNGCVLRIDTEAAAGNPPLQACVRGRAYHKTFLTGDRIRYPMKRIGERGAGTFERISWKEAVITIADNWKRIKAEYGPGSRYVMYATGVTGMMRPTNLAKRLLSLDGGYLDYYNSYSSACSRYITPYIYGTADSGNSTADLLNTRLLILWGHNPMETQFGTERSYYLNELKKKGVKIIVIDPRNSDTAIYASQWIAVRPSTDSALADGMAYVIWSEGRQDQQFMDRYCVGFDEQHLPKGIPAGESYHSYLFGLADGVAKTPEWAEQICGVKAEVIRVLAREYATAKPACLLPGLGLQRTGNGEQTIRSTALLACLTGNVGIPGGGAGGVGGVIEHLPLELPDKVANPYPGKIPVFQWTKVLEKGRNFDREDGLTGVEQLDSSIKMIVNLAGNTLINQHSDINRTIQLLKDESKCEFILVSDLFMTASAKFADILLPGTSVFEGENMVNPWSGSNFFLFNNQVIKPLFESRFEWEWLKEVAKELNLYEAFAAGRPELSQWLIDCYQNQREREPELPDYEKMKELGGWQYRNPICYIAFEKEVKDIERNPFKTPSGKIEIFSEQLYRLDRQEKIPAIPKYVPCREGVEAARQGNYPMQLIGWHTKRRCHSIHDNNHWLEEAEPPVLWINPEDAAARGIVQGDLAEVYNDRGRVRIMVQITGRVMPGVTAMAQGGWYTPDHEGTDVRGSINVLTGFHHPSPLAKGNPQHTNLVEVRRYNRSS